MSPRPTAKPTYGRISPILTDIEVMVTEADEDFRHLDWAIENHKSLLDLRGQANTKISRGSVGRPTEDTAFSQLRVRGNRFEDSTERKRLKTTAEKVAKEYGRMKAAGLRAQLLMDELYGRTEEKAEAAGSGSRGSFLEDGQYAESVQAKARRRRERGEL